MRLNEIRYGKAVPVDGYGPGFFRVAGVVWQGPVLVTAEGAAPWQGFADLEPLLRLVGQVDVLFVGTGAEVAHLPGAMLAALEAAGIGVEPMASPTAARTYNVVLSEGRRVAAALLPL